MTDRPDHPDRRDPDERDTPPGDVERVRRRFGRGDDAADDRAFDPERSAAFGGRIRELTADLEAPPRLRARIATAAQRTPRRRRRLLAPVGAAVAAAAVAVALVLAGGGNPGAPTVDDAAALALSAPTAPAPAVDPFDAHLVDAKLDTIKFPNYAYAWDKWKAVGRRADTLNGRAATTVTYRGPLGDVGYTIVDGAPLDQPDHARWVTADGHRYAIVQRGDATVVTWRRAGHTCVLAGRTQPGMEERLVSFASWA